MTDTAKTATEWETIGEIGVDAGLCWVGDPCYIMHREQQGRGHAFKDIGENWQDFCRKMGDKEYQQFNYDAGHPGLGVACRSGHGDGTYPVQIRRADDGSIAELRVTFITPEEEQS